MFFFGKHLYTLNGSNFIISLNKQILKLKFAVVI